MWRVLPPQQQIPRGNVWESKDEHMRCKGSSPSSVTPWETMLLHGNHFLFLSVLLYNDRFVRKATSKDTGEEMHKERFREGQAATVSGHCQLQLTSTWSALSEMFKYDFNLLFCYLVLCLSFRCALCYNPHEEVRGQLCRVSSFYPLSHGFWNSNTDCKNWAEPLPTSLRNYKIFYHLNTWSYVKYIRSTVEGISQTDRVPVPSLMGSVYYSTVHSQVTQWKTQSTKENMMYWTPLGTC